jgi:surface polysaccharide O-acyltransferase-like enzyme
VVTSPLHSRRRSLRSQSQPQVKRVQPPAFRPRDLTLDTLRIIACFAVILQHASAGPLIGYGQIPESSWWTANILNALTRCAVPLFLMISGALLINRPGLDGWNFYTRRLSVLAKPYLLASAVYVLYLVHLKGDAISPFELLERIRDGGVYYHFYYLHLVIGLYLLVPFLIIRSQRDMAAALFMCVVLLLFTQLELAGDGAYMLTSDLGFFAHLPYFFLGYLLYHLERPVALWWPLIGFLLASACIAFGTAQKAMLLGEFSPGWYQKAVGWLPMIQSCSLFLLVCQAVPKLEPYFRPPMRRTMMRFARATFGIYLYHLIILELAYPLLLRQGFGEISAMLLTTAITFILTGGLILFLQRARILRSWV